MAQPTLSVRGNSPLPEQWSQRWKEEGDERPSGNLLHFSLFFGKAFPHSPRFSSIQFSLSVMSDSLRPMDCSRPGFPVPSPTTTPRVYSNSCPSIESVMPSNYLILCSHLLLLPSIFPRIRVYNELTLCSRWPKYWNFSFSISPSNEYSGLIAFRIDWFDLLAVQRTLKSLLQHHSSKASILRHSAFFMVQLSHPYMTPGKAIALTRWTFVSKEMSLLFNMLSRFVIA